MRKGIQEHRNLLKKEKNIYGLPCSSVAENREAREFCVNNTRLQVLSNERFQNIFVAFTMPNLRVNKGIIIIIIILAVRSG